MSPLQPLISYSRKIILAVALVSIGSAAHAQSSAITASSPSSIAGTATPTSGATITAVDLSIRSGSLFWNGSAFTSAWARVPASVSGNNWSYAFNPSLTGGIFQVSVRSFDSSGAVQSPMTFGTIVLDSVRPTSTVTATSATAISGAASDTGGSGLDRVEISIRNTNVQFWNGSSFQAAYTRVPTTLSGASWSYAIGSTLPNGTYHIGAVAFDNAGNAQSPLFNTSFTVNNDSIAPTTTISSTTDTLLFGTASDNISLDRVELAISNGTGFWNGSVFTSYNRVVANLGPNPTSAFWSYEFPTPLPAGNYSMTAIAFDSAGNAQAAPFTSQSFTTGSPLKILALGDSITAGADIDVFDFMTITSYREDFEMMLDATDCYYEMVGGQIDNDPVPTSFKSPHEGYSGHRADQFITGHLNNPGIDAIMANEMPDVVMIHLGSNDIFIGEPVQSTIFEINEILGRIYSANPDAIILLANVIPWYGNSPFNPNIQADITALGNGMITLIQGIASPQLRLANVRNGFFSTLLQADGIHPNTAGEEHIAERFLEALDQSGACGVPL